MTPTIQRLAEKDVAVLVRNLAGELLKLPVQQSLSHSSRRVQKRTQSMTSGSTPSVLGSPLPTTPQHNSLYYDSKERMGMENAERDRHRERRGDGEGQKSHSRRNSRISDTGIGGTPSGRRIFRGGALRTPNQPASRVGNRAPSR